MTYSSYSLVWCWLKTRVQQKLHSVGLSSRRSTTAACEQEVHQKSKGSSAKRGFHSLVASTSATTTTTATKRAKEIASVMADSEDRVHLLSYASSEDDTSTCESVQESPYAQVNLAADSIQQHRAAQINPNLPNPQKSAAVLALPSVSGDPVESTGSTITADCVQKQEWVFTLYDLDGKGNVSKQDIRSLVRSIYDVLGSAKIQLRPPNAKNGDQACLGEPAVQSQLGSCKIRLTLIVDSASFDAKLPQRPEKPGQQQVVVDNEEAVPEAPTVLVTDRESQKAPSPPTYENLSPKPPTLAARHRRKRQSVSFSPVATPRRKTQQRAADLRHRSQNHDAPPAPAYHVPSSGKEDCARTPACYRDYVNLSELENCCGRHSSHQKYHSGWPDRAVHHIRHCDRHCVCPPHKQVPCRYPEYAELQETPCWMGPDLCNPLRMRQPRARNCACNYSTEEQSPYCSFPIKAAPDVEIQNVHWRKPHRTREKDRRRSVAHAKELDLDDRTESKQRAVRDIVTVQHRHSHQHYHYHHCS